MPCEGLRVLALLISSTIDQVSLKPKYPIHLLAHLADLIQLALLMYNVGENCFKILCMMCLLGLLNCLCNLGILMLKVFCIFVSTGWISIAITRYISTAFRLGIDCS